MEDTLEMRGGGWWWPDLVGLKHRPILTPGSDASRISNMRHSIRMMNIAFSCYINISFTLFPVKPYMSQESST